jgi:transposase
MSYSIDFRKQVFKIKERDSLTYQQTSERFGVSMRTLFKWKTRIEPKLHRNKPATKIDMAVLQKHVEDYPDSYQHERAAHFGVSPSCILYALRRLHISNKKTLVHPSTDAGKRAEFEANLHLYEQVEERPVIHMDESGFSVDAPRDRGYSFRGKRCYGSRDRHSRGRVNLGLFIILKY